MSSTSNVSVTLGDDHGFGKPKKCGCGGNIVVFTSTTEKNPCRQFLRCENYKKPNIGHVFKWLDETILEELELIREEQRSEFHSLKDCIEEAAKKSEMERKMIAEKMVETQSVNYTIVKELKGTIRVGLLVTFVVVCVVLFNGYVFG